MAAHSLLESGPVSGNGVALHECEGAAMDVAPAAVYGDGFGPLARRRATFLDSDHREVVTRGVVPRWMEREAFAVNLQLG